ncbi:MAG: tripartite tricarboxylate transporter TctB family protein [Betaproteobacteria bacterium]|nr:tripartite tricarboxylate transporter TctB family protein [Betaproteobacteria bacterium]MDE2049055.1 tripartite tricarboxylate transporter TctB family protein [Betaproteobacteria bacterium]
MTPDALVRRKDQVGGLLLLVVGGGAALQSTHYSLGTLGRMGPGYFPLTLSVLLMVCGVLVFVGSLLRQPAVAEQAPSAGGPVLHAEPHPAHGSGPLFDVRAWGCVLGGLASFIVLGQYGGLLPASFAVVFISALGDRQNSWRMALLLALILTVVAWLLFGVALKLNMPLIVGQ